MVQARRGTRTSTFGVSRRENHDASAFYDRFEPPLVVDSEDVRPHGEVDDVFLGDARSMTALADDSVALVVTSPPYFAGKEYEQDVGAGHVPATYREYLRLLEDVFRECVRVLEPGGRIAVNVANLGRKPYRSLSSDVIRIFERHRLLLRGEVVWVKARGATGSTAWGTFQRPANPVLRDLTERIVIASKGRFDRAVAPRHRQRRGLPHEVSIWRDEFMDATVDVWEIAPESATRVNHPAPFPVEVPRRLIELYTYRGDLVLDPFMGSGTTAVAALRSGRHFAGYEIDPGYRETALDRIAGERASASSAGEGGADIAAVRERRGARDVAREMVLQAGFADLGEGIRVGPGVEVDLAARDRGGLLWLFLVAGGFTVARPGLTRTDVLWRTLGQAGVMASLGVRDPLVVLTPALPPAESGGGQLLRAVTGPGKPVAVACELLDPSTAALLRDLAAGAPRT